MITPILLDKSAYGAYFLFGGLALGTTAVLAMYMPETRGRSLESIQDAFNRPVLKGVNYYLRKLTARNESQEHHPEATGHDVELESRVQVVSQSSVSIEGMARAPRLNVSMD